MNKKIIGEERRHQTRIKQIEAVKTKSRRIFQQTFPNPKRIPTQADFSTGWEKYTQNLMSTFGKRKDFHLAFKVGENIVKKYQELYAWPYSPASQIVINKPDIQLRSQEWLRCAWNLYDSYEQWLADQQNQKSNNTDIRYQSLLLSFIFDSGHASQDVVKAFHLQLQKNDNLALRYFGNNVFISLTLDSDTLNTNDNTNGDNVTTIQCFLSLKTLGQLNRWQNTNASSWTYPEGSKQLYKLITHKFNSPELPKTLKQFCSTSIFWYERHSNSQISEALLEYKIGRTHSYSLPTSNLIRLISPTLFPVTTTAFSDFSTDVAVNNKRQNKTENGGQALAQNQFIRELKAACKPKLNGQKVSPQTIRGNLERLLNNFKLKIWQQVFIEWLTMKSHSCTANTVNQYMLNQAKHWFMMNEGHELLKINDSVELEELYFEQITAHRTQKAQHYYSHRLKELHAFAAPLLNLPMLSESFFHIYSPQKHTRTGLIDEPLFNALLSHINQLTDLNHTDKLALQTLCIISYRCGLRINELHKLLIENIEESAVGWISVRPNRFGDNKTASALRKVPLFPMLLSEERKIVSSYLRYKRTQKLSPTAPLLTMGTNQHQPFDHFSVSNYVGRLLKAMSGEAHLVFHHLRHSCLSRLQLMLEAEKPHMLLPYFYPYSEKQTASIKRLLFKKTFCKGYWEIAAFAGHETPKVTFEHYFHLSDLLSSKLVENEQSSITRTHAEKLGLSTKREFQKLKKLKHAVTYIDCYPFLLSSLDCVEIKPDLTTLSTTTPLKLPVQKLINLNICYQTIEAISLGESIKDISYRYCLEQTDINKWLGNAYYLKSLTTNANNKQSSRHFSSQRKRALLPGKLKNQRELKYVDGIIEKLRVEYKDEEKKHSIQQMMIYCLTHASVSKSGVTFNSPEILRQFIETFRFAIPLTHWRAVKLYINNSTLKSQWQESLKGVKTVEEKRGTRIGRTAKGSIRLELVSPIESEYLKKGRMKKYSTHLLVYLMYMTYVMINNPS
ncbi:hypothetical protein C1M56_10485 [Vibrio diazotrophicus]|nr:hypothetical protein C1M56_10485 [Vibrio diazotrophicus]